MFYSLPPFFLPSSLFSPAISFLFWGFFPRWVVARSLARKQNGLNKERTIAPHHRHSTRPRRNISTICFVFLSLEVVTGASHHLLWWEYHNIVEPSFLHSFNQQEYVRPDYLINLPYLSTLSFNVKLGYVVYRHSMYKTCCASNTQAHSWQWFRSYPGHCSLLRGSPHVLLK